MQKIQVPFWVVLVQISTFTTLLGSLSQEFVNFDSPIQLVYDVSRWENQPEEKNIIVAENESSLIDEIAFVDNKMLTKEKPKGEQ